MTEQRDSGTVRLPKLPWCRDCWHQVGPDDGDAPDVCPDCGGEDTTRL